MLRANVRRIPLLFSRSDPGAARVKGGGETRAAKFDPRRKTMIEQLREVCVLFWVCFKDSEIRDFQQWPLTHVPLSGTGLGARGGGAGAQGAGERGYYRKAHHAASEQGAVELAARSADCQGSHTTNKEGGGGGASCGHQHNVEGGQTQRSQEACFARRLVHRRPLPLPAGLPWLCTH